MYDCFIFLQKNYIPYDANDDEEDNYCLIY